MMTVNFTFAIRSGEVALNDEGDYETAPITKTGALACGNLVRITTKVNLFREQCVNYIYAYLCALTREYLTRLPSKHQLIWMRTRKSLA